MFALVDDEDYEYLSQWQWHYGVNGYAMRTTYIRGSGRKNQKNEYVLMHRLINKTPPKQLTDHINRNKLDNRKTNLRSANKSLNSINRPLQPNNKSGHKGVHWFKRVKLWQVYLDRDGKRINVGYFADLDEAVMARQRAEQELHLITTRT